MSQLTKENRKELEGCGALYVRLKLTQYGGGRHDYIGGFSSGNMTRSDIEGWLAEQNEEEMKRQSAILWWAKIAAWAAIIGAVSGLAGICISMLQR